MTEREMREKRPNIVKLLDFISEQDRPTQFAALLLIVAAGSMGEETEL